ncbi:MSU1 [Candida margitis]|uniref:MSU1 n=1 Tax=Candida margitis TaxID=1775924 RepID=UPI00222712E5|nr:MSU1 [Candida margitis]KAI5960248.1 MSU1 [Candida margitis]
MFSYTTASSIWRRDIRRRRSLHYCAYLRRRYVKYNSSTNENENGAKGSREVLHDYKKKSNSTTKQWSNSGSLKFQNFKHRPVSSSKWNKSLSNNHEENHDESTSTNREAQNGSPSKEFDMSSLRSFIKSGQELARDKSMGNEEPKHPQDQGVDKESFLDNSSTPKDSASDLTKLVGMIKTKKKYFDIEQPNFNLDRPNKEILDGIKSRSEKSKKLSYRDPSNSWKEEIGNFNELKSFFKQLPQRVKINGNLMNSPVRVGDLVTFGSESLRLYIVAETPKSFDSRIATFLSDKGEIVFSSFSNVNYRIPQAIPEKYMETIGNFVTEEQKYLDNPPVGIPDLNFTRSAASLPIELQKGETETTAEVEGEVSEYDSNDLVLSQASSQLLTNSNVRTFIIPNAARELFHAALTQISNNAFRKVHETNKKLEGLHRILQNDETGEINTPRSISIFEILSKLNVHSEPNVPSNGASFGISPNQSVDYASENFVAAEYLSVLFALRKQSRLWTIQRDKASFSPTKVIIWPLAQVAHEDEVIRALRGKEFGKVAQYCTERLLGKTELAKPTLYDSVVNMLKEYVNGKFDDDPMVSTTLISLLRRIDSLLLNQGEVIPDDSYKFEYSFGKAYDLLTRLNQDVNVNPVKWTAESDLPGQHTSIKADLQGTYFKYFDKVYELREKDEIAQKTLTDNLYENDPLSDKRIDMKEVSIYCIDDATAHEIDDGISLHEENGKYVVTIHIAEPSSYIKPDSIISSIAYGKASTTYLPEAVFPMLPQMVSKIAGLGSNGVETRTFVVQYKLNKRDVDDCISRALKDSSYAPDKVLLDNIKKNVYDSSEVKFALTKRFRQGFTYDAVNKLLLDDCKISKYRDASTSGDADFDNLIKLQYISSLLWRIRESNNAYTSGQNKKLMVGTNKDSNHTSVEEDGSYKLSLPNSDKSIEITSESTNNLSTQLVTENMIIANHLTAKFANDKGIKILYRSLDPKFNPELLLEYKELVRQERSDIDQEKLLNLYAFLTRGIISDKPEKHFMMGLNMYTNISSPLRRFIDMVNQWKFQDYFLGKTSVSDESIGGIVSKLNAKNDIVRSIQRDSITFWQLLFLKIFHEQNSGNITEMLDLKLSLRSNPKKGMTVAVNLKTFSSVNAHVDVSQELLEDVGSGHLGAGDLLDSSKLHLKKIDVIENLLIFEYR